MRFPLYWSPALQSKKVNKEPMTYSATEVALTKATKELWEKRPVTFKFKADDPEMKVDAFQGNRIYALVRSTASQYYK